MYNRMDNSENPCNIQTGGKEFNKIRLVKLNELIKFPQKRKPYNKWTIEQKKSLIESRIEFEYLFNKNQKRSSFTEAWKHVVKKAKLEEFGQIFVRKQWQNFITKYKSLVHSEGITNFSDLNEKQIRELNLKWEFFRMIHNWIISRDNDVELYEDGHENFIRKKFETKRNSPLIDHEYGKKAKNIYSTVEKPLSRLTNVALTATKPVLPKMHINPNILEKNVSLQSIKKMNTNTITREIQYTNNQILNNDHNYIPIPKTICKVPKQQQKSYNNKSIRERIPSSQSVSEVLLLQPPSVSNKMACDTTNATVDEIKIQLKQPSKLLPIEMRRMSEPPLFIKQELEDIDTNDGNYDDSDNIDRIDYPSSSSLLSLSQSLNHQHHLPSSPPLQQSSSKPSTTETKIKKRKNHYHKKRSYTEKLYKHTKRSTHRIEERLDAFLNVFAQMVKHDYPNVNVDPLLNPCENSDTTSTSNSDSE